MVLIETIEHKLAVAAQDAVKAARFIEHEVVPALQRVQASQDTIESVTALISPQAANIERAAFAVLGKVLSVIQAGQQASAAGGMNIEIDAELVAAVRAVAPAMQGAMLTLATTVKAN